MADDKNPIVENKLTDENPTVKKNKYLFGGVGAVLGGLTGVAIGGPLIAVVGAGLGGLLGFNMLKRL
jgi:predicted lipid-binding transport protein (Tim44 family)